MLVVLNHIDTVPEARPRLDGRRRTPPARRRRPRRGAGARRQRPRGHRHGRAARPRSSRRVAAKKSTTARIEADVKAAAEPARGGVRRRATPRGSRPRAGRRAGGRVRRRRRRPDRRRGRGAVDPDPRPAGDRLAGDPGSSRCSGPIPLKRLHLDLGAAGKHLSRARPGRRCRSRRQVERARVDAEVRGARRRRVRGPDPPVGARGPRGVRRPGCPTWPTGSTLRSPPPTSGVAEDPVVGGAGAGAAVAADPRGARRRGAGWRVLAVLSYLQLDAPSRPRSGSAAAADADADRRRRARGAARAGLSGAGPGHRPPPGRGRRPAAAGAIAEVADELVIRPVEAELAAYADGARRAGQGARADPPLRPARARKSSTGAPRRAFSTAVRLLAAASVGAAPQAGPRSHRSGQGEHHERNADHARGLARQRRAAAPGGRRRRSPASGWRPRRGRFQRKTGTWVDGDTQWYTVNAWRDLADNCAPRCAAATRSWCTAGSRGEVDRSSGAEMTSFEIDATFVGHDLSRGTSQFTGRRRPSPSSASTR